jgi:hypothetical protein
MQQKGRRLDLMRHLIKIMTMRTAGIDGGSLPEAGMLKYSENSASSRSRGRTPDNHLALKLARDRFRA